MSEVRFGEELAFANDEPQERKLRKQDEMLRNGRQKSSIAVSTAAIRTSLPRWVKRCRDRSNYWRPPYPNNGHEDERLARPLTAVGSASMPPLLQATRSVPIVFYRTTPL